METAIRPAGASDRRPQVGLRALAPALALIAVGLQLAYPLLDGAVRDHVTVAIVAVFALTTVTHAAVSRGAACAAAMCAITAGGGFAIEQLGVHAGVPFGEYTYGSGLGPTWFGVPPVVALAWTMLAWPATVAARAVVTGRFARVVVGAWALTATDLFLDPQMVRSGYWTWHTSSPHLPGVGAVPLSNYGGWLVAGLAISVALQRLIDSHELCATRASGSGDRLAVGLYLWLCIGWVIALAGFDDLPAAAAWGALATGPMIVTLALPAARRRWARTA